jgi:hypothetical protein
MGVGDEQVEPFDEAAVAGGFGAPAAGGGVDEIPLPGGSSVAELRAFYSTWRSELTA